MDRLRYVFVIFFVTLGPIKLFGPFLHLTANFDPRASRRLAMRGAVIATVAGLCIVFLGNRMREQFFGGIMLLNYLAMIFAGPILRTIRPQALQPFGWVMAVLPASLAVLALMQGLRLGLLGQPLR
jgi:multiple antibiotic resistance protein